MSVLQQRSPMEMNNKIPFLIFGTIGLSILVNLFLFALLPFLGRPQLRRNDIDAIVPVNLVNIRHQEPPPPKEEKLPDKKPPVITPTVRMQSNIPKRQIRLKMPKLSFEINPKLSGGLVVAPPPPISACYQMGEVDQVPLAVFQMKPVYPYRAMRLNMTGNVDVKFLVDGNGRVSRIKILKSDPPGVFDKSVLNTLPSWKFSPAKLGGEKVSCWVITNFEFQLEDK
jgi:periplasmic protein TonB